MVEVVAEVGNLQVHAELEPMGAATMEGEGYLALVVAVAES